VIIRPRAADYKVVGLYTGKVVRGVGVLMLLPLAVAIAYREWNPAIEFTIGIGTCLIFGYGMEIFCQTTRILSWGQGLVVASLSWLIATLLGAIPPYLSLHYGSYLDSVFDVMSGFTTTGLMLIQDLDHASNGLNMWRHLLQYIGGQGMVVMALTFLVRGTSGAFKLYAGEAREERLLPNIIKTARAIWLVALTYLALGTIALTVTGITIGQRLDRAFFHALWVFMAGWGTGGYTPQSYSTLYYHSMAYDLITIAICILGSYNFALHWAVWNGNRKELFRNIEIKAFFATMAICMVITTAGLVQSGIYPEATAMFRKMFYVVASGHTGTGFATVYSRTFVRQWGELAMMGVILAMAIGGGSCSTSGGMKGIRIGIIVNAMIQYVRRFILPENAVVVQKYHHITNRIVDDTAIKGACIIVLSYVGMYAAGTLVGTWCGFPMIDAMFDSTSACANVGLTCGITTPAMPTALKVCYIIEMWGGRLEFMALFALSGYIIAMARGK
jgi:trk system potassium uptake protein TrkH